MQRVRSAHVLRRRGYVFVQLAVPQRLLQLPHVLFLWVWLSVQCGWDLRHIFSMLDANLPDPD